MKFFKDLFYLFFYARRLMLKPVLRTKEIVVLLYHAVGKNRWYASVNPLMFKMQMRYLRKHYHVVPLADVVRYQKGEIDLPDKSVAITFDDGYEDNYKIAWPILKKNKLPFTIFVTAELKPLPNLNNDLLRISWPELKQMAEAGVDIGGHGLSHKDLPSLSEAELQREVGECYRWLRDKLGRAPQHFSYPGGKYNQSVMAAVQQAGFTAACTTHEGLVKKKDNVYEIKRVWVHRNLGLMSFLIRLTMVIDWVTLFKLKRRKN
ncbi:TPA: hypothetical protein DCL28_04880 [Candidatus Komeilibacteria bacterium]|nr:MAG: hypothetical protein A3J95_00845 [Candidatus Komeilibacteria bacterium RIFOXYC2_FULL_45_12]OGY94874.1 MAG: hypothetical protein A2260_02180 [Candidatus Komeilibacteria bacterium RIFOXYA2_FULL_45_9]HAH04857.1 hypothetical protein [Candidatus Komeilibacteria bacterium]HBR13893.1 hypothetical protein [Candidatus Komeilibacteria bacterium]HBV02286.1 hypothetical protein [Candidatus Komeilibacteria bacterium]